MSYKYETPPEDLNDIVWIRLIKPYTDKRWKNHFPKEMCVGDITWTNGHYWFDKNYCLIEDNRYYGNFLKEYFELVSVGELIKESQYEIY